MCDKFLRMRNEFQHIDMGYTCRWFYRIIRLNGSVVESSDFYF
jgi:hypothetical protein